jgi:hypothetical protein
MHIPEKTMRWLLDSDPAIRCQVLKHLNKASPAVWQAERQRVAQTGWGAIVLARQSGDGLWNGQLYNGKWVSTTYSLYLLKLLGLEPGHPQALAGCQMLLNLGLYQECEVRFSKGKAIQDLGVSGLVLSLCAYFGHAQDKLTPVADYLIQQQHPEGFWLPNKSPAVANYIFETTRIVLEALHQFNMRNPGRLTSLSASLNAGWEYLLRHQLFQVDGQPFRKQWTTFSFPPYWHYDVLSVLDDYCLMDRPFDERLWPAIRLFMDKHNSDLTWNAARHHAGKTHFEMDQPGHPGRWNTLRSLRVLKWCQAVSSTR